MLFPEVSALSGAKARACVSVEGARAERFFESPFSGLEKLFLSRESPSHAHEELLSFPKK